MYLSEYQQTQYITLPPDEAFVLGRAYEQWSGSDPNLSGSGLIASVNLGVLCLAASEDREPKDVTYKVLSPRNLRPTLGWLAAYGESLDASRETSVAIFALPGQDQIDQGQLTDAYAETARTLLARRRTTSDLLAQMEQFVGMRVLSVVRQRVPTTWYNTQR